jgi:hypothetical protein|tara:strand:+ start:152 stop:370 length:219 start_codon:yes stop_codon:yes gene_type:complete
MAKNPGTIVLNLCAASGMCSAIFFANVVGGTDGRDNTGNSAKKLYANGAEYLHTNDALNNKDKLSVPYGTNV